MTASAGDRRPTEARQTRQRLDSFAMLSATASGEGATAERRAGRLHRLLEQEASTLRGLFIEVAEQRKTVVIGLNGLTLHGTVTAIGSDFAILFSTDLPTRWIVRTSAVTSMTCVGRIVGDRTHALSSTLHDLASELTGIAEHVDVLTTDGTIHSGILEWVGVDFLAVRNLSSHQYSYLPTASVSAMATG